MKKFAICAMCALLLISSLAACGTPTAEPSPSASPVASPEATPTSTPVSYDWNAMYAAYTPETVVMTVNGEDVSWGEFFYWMYNDYLQYFYGYSFDTMVDSSMNVGQYLAANAMAYCAQYHVIDQQAKANNVVLTADDQAVLDEQLKSDIESLGGEEGTEEAMYEQLATLFVTPELYEYINRMSVTYPRMFITLYGENGANVTDEETLAFADEFGFMTAKHILFVTVDDEGNALSDEEKAAKRSEAESVLSELRAVPEADREALFDEMMQQYSEDPGLERYPEGYCFEPGMVVQEFEDGVAALDVGEISDIVESSNGYHILLREPVTPEDGVLMNTPEVYSLRYTAAVYQFNELYNGWLNEADVAYTADFENFDIASIAA